MITRFLTQYNDIKHSCAAHVLSNISPLWPLYFYSLEKGKKKVKNSADGTQGVLLFI